MNTKELIDRIFKEPGVKFELTEFENLGKSIHDIIAIYPKAATTGKDAGKTKYYPFDIREFLVWPAPAELQRELRDLYDKATTAEQESKRLLEQAKTRVEQLIEAAVQP